MKTEIIKQIELQIFLLQKKFNDITKKYSDQEHIHVKDLEDMKRYSEILLNLSRCCETLYRW